MNLFAVNLPLSLTDINHIVLKAEGLLNVRKKCPRLAKIALQIALMRPYLI